MCVQVLGTSALLLLSGTLSAVLAALQVRSMDRDSRVHLLPSFHELAAPPPLRRGFSLRKGRNATAILLSSIIVVGSLVLLVIDLISFSPTDLSRVRMISLAISWALATLGLFKISSRIVRDPIAIRFFWLLNILVSIRLIVTHFLLRQRGDSQHLRHLNDIDSIELSGLCSNFLVIVICCFLLLGRSRCCLKTVFKMSSALKFNPLENEVDIDSFVEEAEPLVDFF